MKSTPYEYTVEQCDVDDKKALKAYRGIRDSWLDWFDYDEHSIRQQMFQMSWDYALFHAVNGLRKIISENPKPNVGFNDSISRLFDSGFFTTQVFFIRRLVDKRCDVISMTRLIDDMKRNISLFTRENYICYDGLPYDAENLELEWLQQQVKEKESQAKWLDTKGRGAWATSKQLHKDFDALSETTKDSRNRCDRVAASWFDKLANKLKICEDIKLYSHKYMAHAADKNSRDQLSDEQKGITLGKIDDCHKAIFQVSLFIARIIGKPTCISPLPTPQYDHLKDLDKPWADAGMMSKAFDLWEERVKEVETWENDLWPD